VIDLTLSPLPDGLEHPVQNAAGAQARGAVFGKFVGSSRTTKSWYRGMAFMA
jgi:hypothetical protein